MRMRSKIKIKDKDNQSKLPKTHFYKERLNRIPLFLYCMTEVEREKIKLEKKRLKLEEAKLLNNDTTDDESVVIINDIEKESG